MEGSPHHIIIIIRDIIETNVKTQVIYFDIQKQPSNNPSARRLGNKTYIGGLGSINTIDGELGAADVAGGVDKDRVQARGQGGHQRGGVVEIGGHELDIGSGLQQVLSLGGRGIARAGKDSDGRELGRQRLARLASLLVHVKKKKSQTAINKKNSHHSG